MLADLGRPRIRGLEFEPIGGGCDFPLTEAGHRAFVDEIAACGAGVVRAETLLERYGTRAKAVAAWCAARQDAPLPVLPDVTRAEIGLPMENEMVGRLADIVFRRTDIALSGRLTPAVAVAVAEVGGEVLGWDAARRATEVDHVAARAASFHGMARAFASPSAAA